MTNKRRFAKDTLSIGINNICLIVFGLLSSIILARSLGPSGQGLVALILVVPAVLSKFISLGTQASASYFINNRRYSIRDVVSNVITTSIIASTLVSIGVLSIYRPGYLPEGSYLGMSGELFISSFIAIFLTLNFVRVNMIGLFYSLEKYRLSNKYNLLNEALLAVLIIGAWAFHRLNISAIFTLYIINSAVGLISISLDYRKHQIPFRLSIRPDLFREFLAYGLPVYYNSVVQTLQQRISLFFLAKYFSLASVGYYNVAYSVAERLNELSRPIVVTHFPKVIQATTKETGEAAQLTDKVLSRLLAAYVIFELPFIIGVIIFLPILYSESYQASVQLAIILSFSVIALGQTKILNNLLAAMNKQATNAIMLSGGLAINIITSAVAIRAGLDFRGIALATSIAYIATLLMQTMYIKSVLKLRIRFFAPDFPGFIRACKLMLGKNG